MQTMLVARRILIFVALWLLLEGVISLMATCDQVAEQARHGGSAEQANKHCSALTGPILASGWAFLYWLGHILEGYGEAVIAVFTIVLAFATGLLWKATRDLVRGADRTAERQLRAYVMVSVIDFTDQKSENDRCVFRLRTLNTGQTPAYNLRVESRCVPLEHPVSANFDFEIPRTPNSSVVMLGREEELEHISTARGFTADELGGLISHPEVRLYTYGTVHYDDAFGHHRFTNFCYFVDWIPIRDRPPGTFRLLVQASEHHNDGK